MDSEIRPDSALGGKRYRHVFKNDGLDMKVSAFPEKLPLNQLKRLFPNAPPCFFKNNAENVDDHSGDASAKLESGLGEGALGKEVIQAPNSGPLLVRIIATRKCLLDEDNLCEKYLVDCLRYCGAIPNDSPEDVHIEVSQKKTKENEAERVDVEIYQIHEI